MIERTLKRDPLDFIKDSMVNSAKLEVCGRQYILTVFHEDSKAEAYWLNDDTFILVHWDSEKALKLLCNNPAIKEALNEYL